ncbi:nitrous oxide reductase accessory protein NosL [Natronolimnohabitans sp. A-GB9]|uniref:nitrous oxide reductase accessory protein NosL n=1 Tax=Natronolimnohabitans sp. A-GB9 TaxID=3069757 RepID=UPI0027B05C59|nr:nitrous oxide reductase accessory protein NosL [Natronolimnohabitans sp. A-GB9]MDQ2050071.1 nitrous oxide reductase accessory protein NosL [Natronolimnohabitans sp. A-GB9]
MNRRAFITSSGIALAVAVSGCLGDIEGSIAVDEQPDGVTVRDEIDFTVTVANDDESDHEVDVTADVSGEQRTESVAVPAEDSETVTVTVPTGYEEVETGGISFGENEWTVEADSIQGAESGTLSVADAVVEWYQPDSEKVCPVCNMLTEEYEPWAAQGTHSDGSRIEFCSIGCAVEYWITPRYASNEYDGKHEETVEDELVTIWAPDFTDVDLDPGDGSSAAHPGWEKYIDMRDGYFVLDSQTFQKFTTPMPGGSPTCFADYDDALAYVDGDLENLPDDVDMDNVSEDDIVELEGLAAADAGSLYRSRYQP